MALPAALYAAAREARAWLFDDLLPTWSTAGRDPTGGFHDQLDDDAVPLPLARRCRVQARQVYVFAEAGRLGWSGDWRACLDEGVRFLLDRFDREDFFACRLAPDDVADAATDNYEQAFVLFALAKAYGVTRAPALRTRALRLVEALRRERRHPPGGFRESVPSAPLLANPHMHLFEAAVAWLEVEWDETFATLGRELACLGELRLRHGPYRAILERFDLDWRPLPGPAGRIAEPGHQFEWAWLFTRWAAVSGEDFADAARGLYRFARDHGVDPVRDVAFNAVDPDGAPIDTVARLWPQTERLKAALAMRELGEAGAAEDAVSAWEGLKRFRLPANPAFFRDKMRSDGSLVDEPSFASSLYHITGAVAALDRAASGSE